MIVIVGAGIAGLTVAEGLVKRRLVPASRILVLERYPNVGGRVVTNRDPFQYEIGAGRINKGHKRVLGLVKRFGLHTYPIDGGMAWRGLDGSAGDLDLVWKPLRTAIVEHLKGQSRATLATHTVSELLPRSWHPYLIAFPYWAEVHMLRADLALEAFEADPVSKSGGEMAEWSDYVGVREGLDAITSKLAEAVEARGVEIRTRHRIQDIRHLPKNGGFEIVGDFGKKAEAKPFAIQADQVIIATCRCSLSQFSVLKKAPLLRQLQTSPLLRIYAAYPPQGHGKPVWFQDIPKTVTDSPLRFVIPIDPAKGLIMISYTDGPTDTGHWRDLEGKALEAALAKEVKRLWGIQVPPATYLQKHDWPAGCTYWVPGRYDVEAAIKAAMNPAENLFVVGESVARHQAWIESALESAERFLRNY
jgi:monoamine oxidase